MSERCQAAGDYAAGPKLWKGKAKFARTVLSHHSMQGAARTATVALAARELWSCGFFVAPLKRNTSARNNVLQ